MIITADTITMTLWNTPACRCFPGDAMRMPDGRFGYRDGDRWWPARIMRGDEQLIVTPHPSGNGVSIDPVGFDPHAADLIGRWITGSNGALLLALLRVSD